MPSRKPATKDSRSAGSMLFSEPAPPPWRGRLVLSDAARFSGQHELRAFDRRRNARVEDLAVVERSCRIVGTDRQVLLQIDRPFVDTVVGAEQRHAAGGAAIDDLPVDRRA